jgi:ParB family chromosome partitioning protein
MAARKKTKKKRATKKKAGSAGITPAEMAEADAPAAVEALVSAVQDAGGEALARYRDPLGGHWLVLAALPLERVAATPYQRDLSDAHVKRLQGVIERVGTFLDPVIAVQVPEAQAADAEPVRFWTPNGLHRISALARIGAKSVTVLLSVDPGLAYKILALNTEKAHNLKERSLEAMRMARSLAEVDPKTPESAYALELDESQLVTFGLCYEQRARFAGGAYNPAVRASDEFLDEPMPKALEIREARAERLLAIDDRVNEIIAGLKEKGFDSPYLRNFVVARLRPFVPRGKEAPDADALLDHMETKAAKFDLAKVKSEQLAKTARSTDD